MTMTATAIFLESPEVTEVFKLVWEVLLHESDRGAVLVGSSIVDEHLEELLKAVAPRSLSKKSLKELFGPIGPMSTFASKIEIAYLTRLIGENLRDACHKIRKLRNKLAAHSHKPFSLEARMDEVRGIADLICEGLPAHINTLAIQAIMETSIEGVQRSEAPDPMLTDWPPDRESIIDHIRKSPKILDYFQVKAWRLEFGLAVAFLCALIVWYREKLATVLPGNRLVIHLSVNDAEKQGAPSEAKGET